MWQALSNEEFSAALRSIRQSAFRLEGQPTYLEEHERYLVEQFLAGDFKAPTEVPVLADWFDQVRAQTQQGKQVSRVRVQETPPTEYQQLERWCDPWNLQAGESISYISRERAHEIGLLPAAAAFGDWWLLDNKALMTIAHDSEGRRVQHRLTTDPAIVSQAATWRDLATRHSEPSTARFAAA